MTRYQRFRQLYALLRSWQNGRIQSLWKCLGAIAFDRAAIFYCGTWRWTKHRKPHGGRGD